MSRPHSRPPRTVRRLGVFASDHLAARSCSDGRPQPGTWINVGAAFEGIATGLAGMMLILAPPALAQEDAALAIAVGDPGSASYEVGRGLVALLETEDLADGTKIQAQMWESLSPAERVTVLFEETQLAVIPAGEAELQTPRARQQVRAAVGMADGNQVLVRTDLGAALVYQLTQLIFEHPDILRSAAATGGDLKPNESLERIKGPVHPGALRYYEEHYYEERRERPAAAASPGADSPAADVSAGDLPAVEGATTALPGERSFTVYFDFDDATFDLNQVGIVQQACGYAASLPSAEFILSGHADTMGPEPYNDRLSLARAQSVASVIRNDPRFRDALNVIKFGELRPAVPTADEVGEPKNRRVVITVVPGKVDQAMLERVGAPTESAAARRPQP